MLPPPCILVTKSESELGQASSMAKAENDLPRIFLRLGISTTNTYKTIQNISPYNLIDKWTPTHACTRNQEANSFERIRVGWGTGSQLHSHEYGNVALG